MSSLNRYFGGIHEDRLYKIAIISLYIIIMSWLYILLNTPPVRGYEISIYGAYPPFFWLLFALTFILGITLTIYFIVRSVDLWRYSLSAILIANTVVLFLPTIRNYGFYALGGWDIFFHLAWSKFITNTGYSTAGDHYPATHILVATLEQLSSLNPAILAVIVSVAFFILYVSSLFILGCAVFNDNRAGALFSIFGSPLLFSFGHYAFYPYLFALFLFPMTFYVMRKIGMVDNKEGYYICFIILSLFIVFCHPMISLILLLILGVLYGYALISNRYGLGFSCRLDILKLLAIVGISFVFWYINFESILSMGKSVISTLLGESDTETILTFNIGRVSQSGASLIHVIEGFIKVYGPMIIYFVIALFIAIYLVKEFLNNRKCADKMVYIIFFILSIAYGAALTLGYFIVFEVIRAASFAIIMATIICGIGFYKIIKDADAPKRAQVFAIIAIAVLCPVSALSVFNVYSSPWIFSPGWHMTEMEKSGIDWFLTNQDESTPLYLNNDNWRTYPTYFQVMHKVTVQRPQIFSNKIPTHFGYDRDRFLDQSINSSGTSNSYIVTDEMMRQSALAYPEEMQSTRKHFLNEDFFRLNCDTTVNKLYMNREWELWVVRIRP